MINNEILDTMVLEIDHDIDWFYSLLEEPDGFFVYNPGSAMFSLTWDKDITRYKSLPIYHFPHYNCITLESVSRLVVLPEKDLELEQRVIGDTS